MSEESSTKKNHEAWKHLKEWYNTKAPTALKNVAGYVKANPWKSAGLGLLGAGNIAGLVDNQYVGGQLLGGGLGTAGALLVPKLLGTAALSAPATAAIGMGAGTVGALFDALRANADKKRQEKMMLQTSNIVSPNQNQPNPYVAY